MAMHLNRDDGQKKTKEKQKKNILTRKPIISSKTKNNKDSYSKLTYCGPYKQDLSSD